MVEVNDYDTLGGLFKANVKPTDTLVEVNGVLCHMGTIIGRVDTGITHNATNTSVYIPELGRQVAVDSLGYFYINNLPVWNYSLRLAVGDSIIPLPSDTVLVPVTQQDTTLVESLGSKAGTAIISGKIFENSNR